MHATPEPPVDADAALRIPSRTTPTWEVELLISGALVFSLLALRGPLEDAFARWFPLASDLMRQMLFYGYLYAKLALYALALTFILHLAARARWVALVGVHSIYPHGPRWENLSGGPLARRLAERLYDDIPAAIERADNSASLVFAFGILTAQFALSLLLMSVTVVALMALAKALGMSESLLWIFAVAMVVPLILVYLIDRWVVPRTSGENWLSRATLRLMQVSNTATLISATQPLMSLITTNYGGRRGIWILFVVLYLMLGVVMVDSLYRRGDLAQWMGDPLPSPRRDAGLTASHYASLRQGPLVNHPSPHIDAEVAQGPYLRLTLPYVAARHAGAMAEHCPPAAPVDADPAGTDADADAQALRQAKRNAEQARIDCFGRLFEPTLDGRPLSRLEFLRFQHPAHDLDGALAMIDIRDLAPGRHELRLRHWSSRSNGNGNADEDRVTHEVITFWR